MARVFWVIFCFTASGFKQSVSSMSQRIGTAPKAIIDSKVATKVNVGMITSSPAPIPALAKATVNADVPLEVIWQNSAPISFANFCSNSWAL